MPSKMFNDGDNVRLSEEGRKQLSQSCPYRIGVVKKGRRLRYDGLVRVNWVELKTPTTIHEDFLEKIQ
jgi:hypothetical protein